MQTLDLSTEAPALQEMVNGLTIELPGGSHELLSGTRLIPRPWSGGSHEFGEFADASADAIVALGPIEGVTDWVTEIAEWRRVLREGGQVGLLGHSADDGAGVVAMLQCLGGFADATATSAGGGAWLVTATRSATAEIRQPLAAIGRRLRAGPLDANQRAELLYGLGTLLVDNGERELGHRCFDRLVEHCRDSKDARLSLDEDAEAALGEWAQALPTA